MNRIERKKLIEEIRELNKKIDEARRVPGLGKDYHKLVEAHRKAVYKLSGYRPSRSC